MKSLEDIIIIISKNKDELSLKYGLKDIAIFGSYSQGQYNASSDIDILVDFNKPIGIEFIDLAIELEKILNHKVDLVSKNGVKPQYFQSIEKDLTYV